MTADPVASPQTPPQVQDSFGSEQPTDDPDGSICKLAIIITCFNYSQFIRRAVESVLSQKCRQCQILVIDDGSTDGSWEVIRELGVRAFRLANGGQRRACLFGLEQTRAPFVLFLDADDELLPGALEVILTNLDDGVAKLQFPLKRIDGDGNVISGPVPELRAFRGRELAGRVLRTGVYATPPTSGNVFRRDVCELLKDADYDMAVDGIILFAAPFIGDVVSLAQPLGLYRVHDRNDSGFGDELNTRALHRDLQRFVARTEHLRRILPGYGYRSGLVPAEHAYFYRERRFYLAVAEDERIPFASLSGLVGRLWRDKNPLRMKVSMTLFFTAISLLPRDRARKALAYRLGAGTRSTRGLIRALT
ncbi:glycosyltransferase family 2 protein [Neorhizobium galegae]|uniref:Glycosyltransferase n=1 Tax=Neorhizobium galegae bv. officinalis TaxID=323656 RepID=A0A0T7GEJ4_NEOGA|nr:glycosyltransferase family 2 protein [Neorhizobium galegae]CDZ45711.1 Glycosyltransferase [Neorhizobium galegae bv. officinalis]